jgi:hypothetical protein
MHCVADPLTHCSNADGSASIRQRIFVADDLSAALPENRHSRPWRPLKLNKQTLKLGVSLQPFGRAFASETSVPTQTGSFHAAQMRQPAVLESVPKNE